MFWKGLEMFGAYLPSWYRKLLVDMSTNKVLVCVSIMQDTQSEPSDFFIGLGENCEIKIVSKLCFNKSI